MAQLCLGSAATATRRVGMMECAPCAIWHQLQLRHRPGRAQWTPRLADFAVDVASAAVVAGGAREVLVPSSLVRFVEAHRTASPTLHAWDTLRVEGRLVTLLSHAEVVGLHTTAPTLPTEYTAWCVPLPAGPLAARMFFGLPLDSLYTNVLTRLGGVGWRAWMRSALTCRYEGVFVPPIRVAETVARVLREGSCSGVVLEAGVTGLTLRWLETATKTMAACGVPLGALTLAVPAGDGVCGGALASQLLSKAMEMGIYDFATCSLDDATDKVGALFAHTERLCSVVDVTQLAVGHNEYALGRAVPAEEAARVRDCVDFVSALRTSWDDYAPDHSGEDEYEEHA